MPHHLQFLAKSPCKVRRYPRFSHFWLENAMKSSKTRKVRQTHKADFWSENKVSTFVCLHGARARWSLKTCWTLTKLSESFNCIMDQSPTEYKSRGEGARTPSRAPKPSRFVTHGRTDERTDRRDTLKSHYGKQQPLFGKATEVAKM